MPKHGKQQVALLIVLCTLVSVLASASAGENAVFQFDGVFAQEGSTPVQTETSYQSENVSITLTTVFDEESHADVSVADIYVRSVECFSRIYGNDKFGSDKASLKKMAKATSALLYMNGDSAEAFNVGLNVGNGNVWRKKVNNRRDVCILFRDGTMRCYTPTQLKESGLYEDASNVWQSFLFGPSLLDENGNAITEKSGFTTKDVIVRNPRSAIGYFEPGHYCFVVVGGRHTVSVTGNGKKNLGADMYALSRIMHDLGCVCAYNLDGGQTCGLWFNGGYVNSLYKNGRAVGDALVICEPGADISMKK